MGGPPSREDLPGEFDLQKQGLLRRAMSGIRSSRGVAQPGRTVPPCRAAVVQDF
jgi:hypothetical protein